MFMGWGSTSTGPPEVLTLSFPKIHCPRVKTPQIEVKNIYSLNVFKSKICGFGLLNRTFWLQIRHSETKENRKRTLKVPKLEHRPTILELKLGLSKAPIASTPLFGARNNYRHFGHCRGTALGFNLTARNSAGCHRTQPHRLRLKVWSHMNVTWTTYR